MDNSGPDLTAQRLSFDLAELAALPLASTTIERTAKGESLRVRFKLHQSLRLRLGKHDFLLVSGQHFLLIDECGAEVRVIGPRCLVGRGSECGATVNQRYRPVSRKHTIVEIEDDGGVQLTDISSLGTFLPSDEF